MALTDVARMIVVAGGLVHHHDHPWPYRALALAFWFGHVPALVRALGYLPGRAVGFGADLPAGVYWQWRRWCTTPGSYLPETGTTLPQPRWAETGIPVDLFAMADDDVVPPRRSGGWAMSMADVPQRRIVLDPQQAGVQENRPPRRLCPRQCRAVAAAAAAGLTGRRPVQAVRLRRSSVMRA